MTGGTQVGDVVGDRYLLTGLLGAGGFGRVWRAHDRTLDVDVAIKQLLIPSAATAAEQAQLLARAEREARSAARLRRHPNVVAVLDVLIYDGSPWIVMDLVEGVDLTAHLAARGPMAPDQVVVLARALLAGLAAVHEAGLVHRDVKPSNVMLAADGQVLLTDFGISIRTDVTLTTAAGLVGTLEYMAPERFDGAIAAPAADLYALGVTLYQAVEGISPFHRDSPTQTLKAIVMELAPEPRHAGRLSGLLGRLMAKDPADRPTVTQCLAMLDGSSAPVTEDAGATVKTLSAPVPPPAATNPSGRRRTLALVGAALAAGGVLVGVIVTSLLAKDAPKTSTPPVVALTRTSVATPSEEAVPDSGSSAAPSLVPSSPSSSASSSAATPTTSQAPRYTPEYKDVAFSMAANNCLSDVTTRSDWVAFTTTGPNVFVGEMFLNEPSGGDWDLNYLCGGWYPGVLNRVGDVLLAKVPEATDAAGCVTAVTRTPVDTVSKPSGQHFCLVDEKTKQVVFIDFKPPGDDQTLLGTATGWSIG